MVELLTIDDLATKSNKSTSTVRTWKRRGDLPKELFITIGGTVYVKENKLDEWLENTN